MRQANGYFADRNKEGYRDSTFYAACGKWANRMNRLSTNEIVNLVKEGHKVEWINNEWIVDGNEG